MSNAPEIDVEMKIDYLVPPLPVRKPPGTDFLSAIPKAERTPRLCWSILLVAFITAVIANLVFRYAAGIGLNVFILAAAFFAGWFAIARQKSVPLWRKLCAGAAIVYAAALGYRASELIGVVNMMLFIGFAGLACSPAAGGVVRSLCLTAVSLFQVLINVITGALMLGTEMPWGELKPRQETARIGWRIVIGLIIATPFLIVFGSLFSQADSRFQMIFATAFDQALEVLFSNFWLTFWAFILALGLLRSAFFARSLTPEHLPMRGQRMGLIESITVLVLLNGMFMVFVATQLPYLFGGQQEVSGTPDLVWSTYARRGFFELAIVVALVVPTLMMFMHLTKISGVQQQKLVTGLCLGLSALTGVIIVSAFQRMLLYTANYGLSELRIYVTTFIVLLALILLLLNVFTMRGRAEWFLPATLCLGVLFSLGIQTVNVQGIVAQDIIMRYQAGKDGDLEYLASMSTDAVPVIWESGLAKDVRQRVCNRIFEKSGNMVIGDSAEYLDHPISTVHAVSLVMGRK